MVWLLVLNLIFGCALSEVQVFNNYTITFPSKDCFKGQKLTAREDSSKKTQLICNEPSSDQLATLCRKADTCGGKVGVVTEQKDSTPHSLTITDETLTFYSDKSCSVSVICYDPSTHCYLPKLKNGRYRNSSNDDHNDDLLQSDVRLDIACDKGYTWHWADFVTCLKMSSGQSRLSSEPRCVPLAQDNLMTLLVNVTKVEHMSALTGIEESLFKPEDSRSIMKYDDKVKQYCKGELCSIPLDKLEATSDQNEVDGPDHVAALSGDYSMCFETSIISLFLMGLQQAGRADEYKDFNVRPIKRSSVTKREIVDNNIEVRISNLDLVYNTTEHKVIGFNVTFYLFQYNRVVHPGVVTKVLGNVSRDKYDVVLESYCRLKYCKSKKYKDQECQEIPTMRFYSYPQPTVPCTFQGKQLKYAEPVPLVCDPNHYNNETNVTLCLYSDKYSPSLLPHCAKCGGRVFSNVIRGPSRINGLNSRGANCVWEIQTSENNTGQFYQDKKGDGKTCNNPVSYLKIREFDSEGNVIASKSNKDICLGVQIKFGSHIEIEFKSDDQSDLSKRFIFEFQPDVPIQPWYKRYMAILIAAPIIVLFFVALVFIGVYCDHKNRKKLEASSPVIQMEYGDQVSNGTWKANDSMKKSSVIEDEAISPQPRIHNAVTKPDQQRRRRKKKRTTPSKTDSAEKQVENPAGAESLSPPTATYDSWVSISNQGGAAQTSTPDTGDMSLEQEGGASQVFHSPVKPKKVRTSINSTAPLLSNTTTTTTPVTSEPRTTSDLTEVSAVQKPRKKKRRKKRPPSETVQSQRPLPALNGGEAYLQGPVIQATPQIVVKRGLPPLEQSAVSQDPNGRALPPIIVNKNVEGGAAYPYISDDLGVD